MLDGTSSEIELLRASMKGQTGAFEVIVRKYQSLVCAITFSATSNLDKSEELAHEAFIRAWTNLAQLEDLAKFRAWLCAIARNVARNYIRAKRRDVVGRAGSLDKMTDISSGESAPVEAVIDKEQQAMISRALQGIPESYREPLVLFYREQKSLKQVAEQLELSEEAARTRVSRGRKLLREQVVSLVEDTLGRTAPGKAFTTGVLASIAGMAIEGSGVASAVGAGAGASAGIVSKTVMSGVAAKIVAATVVAAIGVGAVIVYKQIDKPGVRLDLAPPPDSVPDERRRQAGDIVEDLPERGQTDAARMLVDKNPDLDINVDGEVASIAGEASVIDNTDGDSNAAENYTGVSGVVLDKSTSAPIKGAQVFSRLGEEIHSVITDAGGRFKLVGIQPGERRFVYAIAKGYTTRRVALAVAENGILKDLKIELIEGTKVAGVVRDEKGRPIEGATVETFHFTNHPLITGADGAFEIDGLDPAFGGYSLNVTHADYPAVSTSFLAPKAGQTAMIDVTLKPGVTVHGRVTDLRGNPVARVLVGNTTSGAVWNCLTSRTDDEGLYKLKNVPVGELVLWAVSGKFAPYVEQFLLKELQADRLIDIQLPDPKPLRGLVVDTQGRPMPGANVHISQYNGVRNLMEIKHRVVSEGDGRFVIPNAPASGEVELRVWGEDIAALNAMLTVGQDEHLLTVQRAGRLYGKVLDHSTGAPITRFNVKLSASRTGSHPGWGYAATWSNEGQTFDSAEGLFDTGKRGMQAGAEYRVTIHAEGFEPLTVDPLVMPLATLGSDRSEFRLKPLTVRLGRIVDSNDMPIMGARVRFLTDQNKSSHYDDRDTTFSNDKGQFNLGGFGAEDSCVYITALNYGPFLGSTLNLPRDSEGYVKIVLAPGAHVYGTVLGPEGQGVAYATVSVSVPSWRMDEMLTSPYPDLTNTVTDANGCYEFVDLPSGPLSIRVNSPLGSAHKSLTLEPGQSAELNFGDEAGYTLSGVVRMGQKLLEGAEVMVCLPDRSVKRGKTDKDGRFSIWGVYGGTHNLTVSLYESNTEEWFDDDRWVVVDGDTELDLDVGDGTVAGRIPSQFVAEEGLEVYPRRCASKKAPDRAGYRSSDWEFLPFSRTEIDPQGNFTYRNLRAGRYYLLLHGRQGTLGITDVFELDESEHLENVAFNIGNGRLRISVFDLDTGVGIPHVVFAVKNDLDASFFSSDHAIDMKRRRMATDDQGKAEYAGLPQGKYIVNIDTPRYLPAESEWITLSEGSTASAIVFLEPAAIARFEASEAVLERITSDHAYLCCRVLNPPVGQLVGEPQYQRRLLPVVGHVLPEYVQPEIYLPEGRYEIEYRLYQDKKGVSNTSRPPMLEGAVSVELFKGKTTTIIIPGN